MVANQPNILLFYRIEIYRHGQAESAIPNHFINGSITKQYFGTFNQSIDTTMPNRYCIDTKQHFGTTNVVWLKKRSCDSLKRSAGRLVFKFIGWLCSMKIFAIFNSFSYIFLIYLQLFFFSMEMPDSQYYFIGFSDGQKTNDNHSFPRKYQRVNSKELEFAPALVEMNPD